MKGNGSRPWTSDNDEQLRTLFGKENVSEIAKRLNRSEPAIHYRAQKLNLVDQTPRKQVIASESTNKLRSSLFLWGKWIVGPIFLGGISLVASIYQLYGGPPWPTAPTFTPQPPSAASPFTNPFDVTNKSGISDIHNIAITCRIVFVKASRLNVTRDFKGRLIFPARGLNPILEAGSTSQFTCPFREYLDREGLGAAALDDPIEARIALFAEYKTPSWWIPHWFQAKQKTSEAIFTLDTKTLPPRWTIPLN